MTTGNVTVENMCIYVLSVRNDFHQEHNWCIIQTNTSALNVANVVVVVKVWQYTGEVIQESNHLNVLFVANDLQS